jgi:soluble lytic murein transglycosylase-like protein
MYNKQQQRKLVRRRRIVVNCMCIALIGTAAWFVSSSVAVSDKTAQLQIVVEEKEAQLQIVVEEKEALQREVNRLELVVSNGAFFQSATEWSANEVPYYNIKLSQKLQLYTYTKCADLGIAEDYELVLAMMWQESSYRSNLISGTNDYGLMQINKCNHGWLSEELGITDFLDPYQSIDAGTHIIASLLLKYEDPHKALMAYNYGEGGARSHWNRGTYTSSYSREVTEKQNILLDQLRLD